MSRAAPARGCPEALVPGEGAAIDGRAVVRTGDGAVELLQGEIDGAHAGPSELAALFLSRAPS